MYNQISKNPWYRLGVNVMSGVYLGVNNDATNRFIAMLRFVEISKNAWYVYRRIRTVGR